MITVLFIAVLGMMVVSTQPASANNYFTTLEAGPSLVLIPLLYSPISFFLWFLFDVASLYWLGIRQPLRLVSTSIFLTWSGYSGLLVAWFAIGVYQAFFMREHPLLWLAAWIFFVSSFALGKTLFSAGLAITSNLTSKPVSLARKFQIHLLSSATITTIALLWCVTRYNEWSKRYSYFTEYPYDGATLGIFVVSLILANVARFVQWWIWRKTPLSSQRN